MNVICMIPAKLNSSRVKKKNLRYLGGKTLIEHTIDNAKKSKCFSKIFVNSESLLFKQIAEKNNVSFYKRPKKLSYDTATNDDFMYDFLKKKNCDYVIQLLPTSPFISPKTIQKFYNKVKTKKFNSIISIKKIQIECLFKNKPINFSNIKKTPRSQDLESVNAYACGIMAWNKKVFIKNFKQFGAAYYGAENKVFFFEIKGEETVDIDNEEDFKLAEKIYSFKEFNIKNSPLYFSSKVKSENNVKSILKKDGVKYNDLDKSNTLKVNIIKLIKKKKNYSSWSKRLIDTENNSATLISQKKGEGNRRHYHNDWNEWWYIIEGLWQFEINKKIKIAKKGDLVFIKKNSIHKIKALGKGINVRLAVSRRDVKHIYC